MMVTKERKQALLLQAMHEKREWIYTSSPFRTFEITDKQYHENQTVLFPTLSKFATSKVSQYLPDALNVLDVLLHGVDDTYNPPKWVESESYPSSKLHSLIDMERHLFNQVCSHRMSHSHGW